MFSLFLRSLRQMLNGQPRGGRVNTANGGEQRERSVDAPEHGRML
jgi:hypothetical protein